MMARPFGRTKISKGKSGRLAKDILQRVPSHSQLRFRRNWGTANTLIFYRFTAFTHCVAGSAF